MNEFKLYIKNDNVGTLDESKKSINTNELKDYIESGCVFTAAVFDGKHFEKNFKSQQIFKIEFDEKANFNDFINMADSYEVMPAIVYHSINVKNETTGFNAIFVFESEVEDLKMVKAVQATLLKFFPKARLSNKKINAMHSNLANKVEYFGDNILTFEKLYFAMMRKTKASSQSLRDMKSWCKAAGIGIYNKMPLVMFGYLKDMTNIYDVYTGKNFNDGIIRMYDSYSIIFGGDMSNENLSFMNSIEKKSISSSDLEKKCRLYEAALYGEEYEDYELKGLVSALVKIKGGKSMTNSIIDADKRDRMKKVIKDTYNQLNKEQYRPMNCESFCPHYAECQNPGTTILSSNSNAKNVIRQIKEIEYKDIDDIYNDMYLDLQDIIDGSKSFSGIHLVKAPTGAGKTSAVVDILSKTSKKVTIALPTHRLKNDVSEKLSEASVDHINIDAQPELYLDFLKDKVNFLNSIGASAEVQKMFRKIASNYNNKIEYGKDFYAISDYIKKTDRLKNEEENILLTHSRACFSTTKNNTLIVDEDILVKQLIEFNSVSFGDLSSVFLKIERKLFDMIEEYENDINMGKFFEGGEEYIEKISDSLDFVIKFNKEYIEDIKRASAEKTHKSKFANDFSNGIMTAISEIYDAGGFKDMSEVSNVLKFMSSSYYSIDENLNINYACRNDFAQDYDKIIVMSATFNEDLYKKFFRNCDVYCHEYGYAKPSDRIQITNKSFSRTTMKKSEIKELAKSITEAFNPGSEVITYKSSEESFGTVHYGATEGIDTLKGKNITVIGTPHVNPSVYTLFHSVIYNVENQFEEMQFMKISNEFYKFDMMSYKNAELQNIQKYLIESEIEQAAGRSRDLRYNCRTLILSNYPTLSSKFKYLNKKEIDQLKGM